MGEGYPLSASSALTIGSKPSGKASLVDWRSVVCSLLLILAGCESLLCKGVEGC